MAGSGKGALRIALEDFLETFEFDKPLFNWYKKIMERFEEEALSTYEELADKLGVKEFLPPILSPEGMRSGMTKRPIQLIPILLAVGMMVLGMLIGVFQPLQRLGSYKVDKLARTNRPSPLELHAIARRLGYDKIKIDDYLNDLGMPEDLKQGYLELARQYMTGIDYVQAYRRNEITVETLLDNLYKQGLSREDAQIFVKITQVIPGVQDLITLQVKEAFDDEKSTRFGHDEGNIAQVTEWAKKQGLSEEWVKRYWRAHWQLPSPQQVFEMFQRLRPGKSSTTVTQEDVSEYLALADFSPFWRERLTQIAYNPITRVDIRRMYKLGLFDREEVKQRYMDIGYKEEDADKLADFTVKYETDAGGSTLDEVTTLTASNAKNLFKKGVITQDEYRKQLEGLKYSPEIIELLMKGAAQEMQDFLYPDFRRDFINDMINEIQKAYANRMITEESARAGLGELSINQTDVDYLVNSANYKASLDDLNAELKLVVDGYLAGSISRNDFIGQLGVLGLTGAQQQKVINQVELQLKYRNRRLTEAQYRAAVLNGVISQEDYVTALVGLGYTDADIQILVALYFGAA